jgi:hypothetical protein
MADKKHQAATWNREDRDLLIELRTEMSSTRSDIAAARAEIKEINTGITARLLNLESNAVSRIELKDYDDRIDSLELWRSALAGAWGVCTLILIPLAFAYFTHSS